MGQFDCGSSEGLGLENGPAKAHTWGMSFKSALFQSALLGLYIAFVVAPSDVPLWAVMFAGLIAGPILITVWFGWLDRRDRKARRT